ncbi:MAG TPA: T9SS type A sorting domain-containing protein [Flavisolibacter sp.]|jgi:hypothetical protein
MKQLCCFIVLLFSLFRLPAQKITAAEYFFDADPGPGAGTPVAVGTPAPSVTFSANIPTASLPAGFHSLAIRAKDEANTWGPFEWRTIYVSAPASNASSIVAAEYFFDNDPGAGAGMGLGISSPGHAVQFSAVIPTVSLQPGFHILAIRTRNAAGEWSLFEAKGFYIASAPVNAQNITAAEYYIDTDPGAGNGTGISIGSGGNAVTFTALIPTASLTAGFYQLAIRARRSDGAWSIVENRGFYLQPAAVNSSPVTEAEYFMDVDPGVGNGSPLSITTPGNSVSQNFLINIPPGTPNGKHMLAIRGKDAAGHWGLFELREITVDGLTLPLNWSCFTAKRSDKKVALEWETTNEINTSHFDVERSNNGFDFVRIGQVNAKGRADNDYAFDDANPDKGLNYYRLKQLDKNGSFKYSAIAKVYFGDAAVNNLRLYPLPVLSSLNIDFRGNGRELLIQVYDAGGKMILNERKQNHSPVILPAANLAKGMYWIVVSDGILQQKGQFIKQ